MGIKRFIRSVMHPARYHGHTRKPPFFEGWYFKVVDAAHRYRYAVIPGIFLSQDPHAFIQVLDGRSGATYYHRFKKECFWAARDRFEVHIGANRFTRDHMHLYLDRPTQLLEGELRFQDIKPWPVTVGSPGIMGWYAWVPTMECYHGVLSMDHAVSGQLTVDGEALDFDGGRGYIEKDWGKSFPSAWIWMQSNHFETEGISLTASIADIPWRRTAFRGFIVGLWHQDRLYRFATYSGAKTEQLAVNDDTVDWTLRDDRHCLHLRAHRGRGHQTGLLRGPTTVEMGKRVAESLTASVEVELRANGSPRPIFAGVGRCAGLEVHNVADKLLHMA